MPQIKCKMCGGLIQLVDNQSVCECEFCGTTQTVPKIKDNDKLMTLHNRANNLRLRNEFDKALLTYENIISENLKDSEAHWGIVLCRYGIEYVDDPKTGKKIPTCHRTQSTPIFEDYDYKQAIECADVIARNLYQEEAEVINNIQKGILAISVNEEPYDIFICYKENDENGKRTRDSVIAQDIYQELTKNKYRVFFSRISLESKLGSQYEPYIYAALKSSKVMLVIGTKPEYYEAVWVKNEWSRYLNFLKNDEKKYIIPCYKDMDAYELPEELLSFQAQDLNKLGFLQDLLRGIDKIFNRNKKEEITNFEGVDTETLKTINSMLKRTEMLIEDEQNEKAEKLLEEILTIDPTSYQAFILSALIDCECSKIDELYFTNVELENNKNIKRAIQFAPLEIKNKLENIINDNKTYLALLNIYSRLEHDNTIETIEKIHSDYLKLNVPERYLELNNKCIDCFENSFYFYGNKLDDYNEAVKILKRGKSQRVIDLLKEINNKNEEKLNRIYLQGIELYNNKKYREAIVYFRRITQYKNSEIILKECEEKYYYELTTNLLADCQKAINHSNLIFKNNVIKRIEDINKEYEYIKKYNEFLNLLEEINGMRETIEEKRNKTNIILCGFTVLFIVFAIIMYLSMIIINKRQKEDFLSSLMFEYSINESDKTIHVINNSSLKKEILNLNLEMPNSLKDYKIIIDKEAFMQNNSLKEIILGNNIQSIGDSAFNNCASLTSIIIPNSVINIEKSTFSGCTSLQSITVSDGVKSIGYDAFSGCSSLTNITIPDSVNYIGDSAFYNCTSLTSITIPDSVTSIGNYAFYNCTSLTSITIPNSVTSIGNNAFGNCTSLTSITIPDSVTSIGKYAFLNCTFLTSITIPDSVTRIGNGAFCNCASLTSITIPDSVTSIENYAFINCTSLTIYCEASLKPSGWSSNWNNDNRPVIWDYKKI